MSKKITSRTGLFGTTVHYDEKGRKIGESRPGFFGGEVHYDAKGRKVGESQPGLFGGTGSGARKIPSLGRRFITTARDTRSEGRIPASSEIKKPISGISKEKASRSVFCRT